MSRKSQLRGRVVRFRRAAKEQREKAPLFCDALHGQYNRENNLIARYEGEGINWRPFWASHLFWVEHGGCGGEVRFSAPDRAGNPVMARCDRCHVPFRKAYGWEPGR